MASWVGQVVVLAVVRELLLLDVLSARVGRVLEHAVGSLVPVADRHRGGRLDVLRLGHLTTGINRLIVLQIMLKLLLSLLEIQIWLKIEL